MKQKRKLRSMKIKKKTKAKAKEDIYLSQKKSSKIYF